MEKKDFSFTYTSRGYMIRYKGHDIGGVSTLEKKRSLANIKYYKKKAELEINKILAGRISPRMKEAIDKIEEENSGRENSKSDKKKD